MSPGDKVRISYPPDPLFEEEGFIVKEAEYGGWEVRFPHRDEMILIYVEDHLTLLEEKDPWARGLTLV